VAAIPVDTNCVPAGARPAKPTRSWPLLILAAPAAAEVWSGWVGIAQKTGFGLVSPLPGLWPSLHLDTAITLPVGVEAYAAYALRAWLASGDTVSRRTRRFARWSAMCSFALGMAGQIAYHLLAQAAVTRAPWAITTSVSCLPVLVLAMGTTLAHMLHADRSAAAKQQSPALAQATSQSPASSARDRPAQEGPDTARGGMVAEPWVTAGASLGNHGWANGATVPAPLVAQQKMDQARTTARGLAAAGRPVSRRALRSSGVKGSNQVLNTVARQLRAELATAGAGSRV
jgi:hypothetical protein